MPDLACIIGQLITKLVRQYTTNPEKLNMCGVTMPVTFIDAKDHYFWFVTSFFTAPWKHLPKSGIASALTDVYTGLQGQLYKFHIYIIYIN